MFSPSNYYSNDNSPMLCPPRPLAMDKSWKPHVEIAPNCPRCASSNTKFCYYNNYSFSQPRYFCKACRRYWTKGGSIRNVPVGGGCRKSRRAKSYAKLQQSRSKTSAESLEDQSFSAQSTTGATEIDLAAVFAKYLNQDSSVSLDNMSSSTNQESVQDDMVMQGRQNGYQIGQEVESLEELVGNELNTYELQSLLEEEVVSQDVLWSDDAAMPSLSAWHAQDFGGIGCDVDHWKNSAIDLMNEDWGTLVLPGFELVPRPYL